MGFQVVSAGTQLDDKSPELAVPPVGGNQTRVFQENLDQDKSATKDSKTPHEEQRPRSHPAPRASLITKKKKKKRKIKPRDYGVLV